MTKQIHFIGICGVAMSALALAFKKSGYRVTGSDVGFYPPVSTHLAEAGVNFYPGWHPDKMVALGQPDLVVVGNVASTNNPEWQYVQKNNLAYKSYPEVVRDFFVKENSIVCAGTYGKSTSTALLTWIFKTAKINASHLFGCISLNNLPAAEIANSAWSIIEGDEYKTARWDNSPKFSYYKPTHLLLTSVVWDHADVYPTEESYNKAFQKLYNDVPPKGVRIISEKASPKLILGSTPIVTYGKTAGSDYLYTNIVQTNKGIDFDILFKAEKYHIELPVLGEYMADNATGCFALAHTLGIETKTIIDALKNFAGVKRRLEKRLENQITIFDDIAHSPTKAQAVLESLRKIYTGKIFAIFEPNSGNREIASLPHYAHAFAAASEVIIPRLTKIKVAANSPQPIDEQKLAQIISETHTNARTVPDDAELIKYIKNKIQPGDVVVFLGSHGFRGMIDLLINELS